MPARLLAFFRREEARKACSILGLAQITLAFCLLFAAPLLMADDCARDWRRAEDCLRTPGFAQGLGTTIGVIATVLVNGAAIATIVLTPPQPVPAGQAGEGGQGQEPPKQYFLNLQTQGARTSLKTDGQDSLWIYASVNCTDPKVDCTPLTAAVTFQPQGADAAWLQLGAPAMTGGAIAVEVCAVPPTPDAIPTPGGAAVYAGTYIEGKPVGGSIPLDIVNEYQLLAWVGGKKEAGLRYDKKLKQWVVPEIVVYFARPNEETPVKPDFQYGFPDPAYVTEPADLFELEEGYSHDDGLSYTFKLKLKDPSALERHFGPGLDQHNGRIGVTITAIDEKQQSYTANVAYSLEPELVPLFWGFERDSRAREEKHVYKEVEFGEFEFVADALDELPVALIFVRGDLIEEGKDPSDYIQDAVDFVRLTACEIEGKGREKFKVEGDTSGVSSLYELKVLSTEGLLATPENSGLDVSLNITGEITGEAARQYGSPGVKVRIKLAPRTVFLKLIVVPGDCQGTSLAVAYAGTAPGASKPLREVDLQLDVVSQGSPQLSPRSTEESTNERGVAVWTLDYRGLAWSNMGEARFKVRCGVKTPAGPPAQCTYCEIDVGANGKQYISQLVQSAGRLELSNPTWQGSGKVADYLWPDSLTGPLNNLCEAATKNPCYVHYTCGQLRDRIWGFSVGRRFSPDLDTASKMNGLDFGKYEIAPIHVFFGLNPAGTEDPYFIDPWWDQVFNPDKVVLTYASEVTKLGACVALLCSGGALALVAMGKVATLAAAGALIKSWLTYGIIAGTYATLEATYYFFGYGFHVGKTPQGGEPWLSGDGSYRETPSMWGQSFFRDAGLKTGAVSPVENW